MNIYDWHNINAIFSEQSGEVEDPKAAHKNPINRKDKTVIDN